jgi:thioester reductase-like protein
VSVDTREERLARRNWLIEAGYAIQRITDYDAWLHRFETVMRALPEQQRQHSLLPLLRAYLRPKSRTAGPSCQPTVSVRPCRKRKSPGQRHPAHLGADHRQIHHQPATTRTAMRGERRCSTSTIH